MSDNNQRKLPGPRQLFPDLFKDNKAAAPAPPPPKCPQPPAPTPPHGRRREETPASGSSHGSLTVEPPIIRSARFPSSEGKAGPPPAQGMLHPAKWGNTEHGPTSPVDKKRYVCEVCDKRFERPSSLETHMNSHTGLRPHGCTVPGCPKMFSTRSNMQRHLRTHHA